jgi:hypothetical protein
MCYIVPQDFLFGSIPGEMYAWSRIEKRIWSFGNKMFISGALDRNLQTLVLENKTIVPFFGRGTNCCNELVSVSNNV